MSHYDTLGVGKDAGPDEIKKSYRKKAHGAHPDKGGSAEAFHPIQLAYDVLSDEKRRAHYDRTGSSDIEQDRMKEAIGELSGLFSGFLDRDDSAYVDIVKMARQTVETGMTKFKKDIKEELARIARKEKALARLRKKTQGTDFIRKVLEGDIMNRRQEVARNEDNLEVGKLMLKIIDEYSYEVDKQPEGVSQADVRYVSAEVIRKWMGRG